MRRRLVPAVGGLVLIAAACSGTPQRDVDAYCAALRNEQTNLVLPVATLDDVDAIVDRYRDLSRRAPLAVQPQWERLAALVQAAATVDITNNEARLRIVQQAYETEQDSIDVTRHAADICQITLDISGTTTAPATTTAATAAETTTAVASAAVTAPTTPGSPPVEASVAAAPAPIDTSATALSPPAAPADSTTAAPVVSTP